MRNKNKAKVKKEDEKKKKKKSGQPKDNKMRVPKSSLTVIQEKKENTFIEEIGKMLYYFGDVRNPLEDTIKIVESYVKKYLLESNDICLKRGGESLEISDILFLFRNDPQKLTRIERFLKTKDKNIKITGKRKRITVVETLFEEFSDDEDKYSLDEYDMKRLTATDIITKDMPMEEYLDYNKCKETTFLSQSKKFKEWIQFDSQISEKIIDLMGFLAHEIVGLLTQSSLIVKREMELRVNDNQFLTIGIATGVMNESLKNKISFITDENFSRPHTGTQRKPIQPHHVYESIRRLSSIKHFY